MQHPRTSAEVAELVGGELWGPGNVSIDGLDTLELAKPGHLTFIGEQAYAGKWAASAAGTRNTSVMAATASCGHDDSRASEAIDRRGVSTTTVSGRTLPDRTVATRNAWPPIVVVPRSSAAATPEAESSSRSPGPRVVAPSEPST